MLNPFPDLLAFALVAPFLVRLALGFYFLLSASSLLKKIYTRSDEAAYPIEVHFTGWLSIVGSVFVLLGFYTQIGALILGAISLYFAFSQPHNRALNTILFVLSLSLLFSGAGFFAFDLPL